MATCGADKERLELSLPHWIYAGDTALHAAAAGYRVEIAKMLLAAGADARAAKNRRASQPLHYAADGYLENPAWDAKRQVQMIRLLLEAGAEVNARIKRRRHCIDGGAHATCGGGVVSLEAGADVKIRNKPGSRLFIWRCRTRGAVAQVREAHGAAEIIQAFLSEGSARSSTMAKGKSVLDWAKSDWIREMLVGK